LIPAGTGYEERLLKEAGIAAADARGAAELEALAELQAAV
jgi:hypothetical protein